MRGTVLELQKNSTVVMVQRERDILDDILQLSCRELDVIGVHEPEPACNTIATVRTYENIIVRPAGPLGAAAAIARTQRPREGGRGVRPSPHLGRARGAAIWPPPLGVAALYRRLFSL